MMSAVALAQDMSIAHTLPPEWRRAWLIGVLCDTTASARDIEEFMRPPFDTVLITPQQMAFAPWENFDAFVVDAWFKTANDIEEIGGLIARLSHLGRPIFLAAGASMRILLARTGHLSGVNAFARPLASESFTDVLATLLAARQPPAELRQRTRDLFRHAPSHAEALIAADEALERIFALGVRPGRLDMPAIDRSADTMIGSLAESGIGDWISGVRAHHDSTYQHCLLVTGAAIAFGHQLRFPLADMRRIALGALLHDIGKARVPVGILDKPGALTPDETAIVQRHPKEGCHLISGQPAITDEVRDIVMSHHEYLDGSGYPNGLMDANIADIVRLVTVADVFGALIERRAYRPALSGGEAYEIMLSMEGKLDMAIVRALKATMFKAPG
jgi:putative nucleotidyltransferase with HDIG domain